MCSKFEHQHRSEQLAIDLQSYLNIYIYTSFRIFNFTTEECRRKFIELVLAAHID